jgi:hypothetical protein
MSQLVIATFVARLSEDIQEIVAQYPSSKSRDVDTISNYIDNKLLSALPQSNHKRILLHAKNEYYYEVVDTFAYFCVTPAGTNQKIAWDLIDDVQAFVEQRGLLKGDVETFLKGKMEYYNDPSNRKIFELKNKVDDVKEQMIINIDRLLERGERIENILELSEELTNDADDYRRRARKVKNQMWRKYVMIVLALVAVILAIIIVIILWACGFPTFYACRRSSS